MADDLIYEERVSSNWTEALFAGFTILFLMLLIWRIGTGSPDILIAAFFFLFVFFFFYSVNYRTLIILLTPEYLKFKFGIFTWTILHVPAHADHRFRWMPSTRSEPYRPLIPTGCRPLFRAHRNRWTTSFGFSGQQARNPELESGAG